MSALGDAIRRERMAAGMTQKRLAELIDVATPYLCNMERGNHSISLARLFEIANLFPDADSTEWLYLKLTDEWGPEITDVMRKWAARTEGKAV